MKFTCRRTDLKRILSNLNMIASKTLQEKPFILIESSVKNQSVRFRAVNRSIRAKETIKENLTVESRGAYCVVSRFFFEAISSLKNADTSEVTIEVNEYGNLMIKSSEQDAEFEMGVFGPNNVTRFDEKENRNKVEIRCEDFRRLISRTLFAHSKTFPSEITFGSNLMKCSAISPIRIATDVIPIDTDISSKIKMHGESLDLMGRLASSKTGRLILGWNDESVSVKCDEFVLTAPIVDIPVPDYEGLFTVLDGNPLVVSMETSEIKRRLPPLSVFAGDGAKNAKIHIENNVLSAELDNSKVGRVKWDMACRYEDDPIDIVLNINYLLDFVRHLRSGSLTIKIRDGKTPVLFREEDTSLSYMLPPVWEMK